MSATPSQINVNMSHDGRPRPTPPGAGWCWRGIHTQERPLTTPARSSSPRKRTFATGYYRPGADILIQGDTGEQCATELVKATYFNKYPRSA